MSRHAAFIWGLLLTGFFVRPACPDHTVAFVGRNAILESDVQQKMAEEKIDFNEALTALISEELLTAEAEARGIQVAPKELQAEIAGIKAGFASEAAFQEELKKAGVSYQTFQKKISRKLKIRKLISGEIIKNIFLSSSELAEAYEQRAKEQEDTYHLKGRDFASQEEAEAFHRSWTPGQETAWEDVGWVKKSELLPNVLAEIAPLSPESISKPVIVRTRWHVFFLVEVRKAVESEESLREMVRNELFQKKYAEKMQAFLNTLQEKTPIRIVK